MDGSRNRGGSQAGRKGDLFPQQKESRYLLSVNVTVTDKDGNEIPARLVYARNHSNRKDWVCFVCTDMYLSEKEILEAYTLR